MEWRVIPGFSSYEISECGDIRRCIKSRTRNIGHLATISPSKQGYLRTKLVSDSGEKKIVIISRLIALAFHGLPPTEEYQARHLDDNKLNNHKSNIEWGTSKENHADARRNGTRDPRGEGNPRAKLTTEQVIEFRKVFSSGTISIAQLSKDIGMSKTATRDMLSGENWPDVPGACIMPGKGRRPNATRR